MKPSFLNLFMKKVTRGRVVPTISDNVSCMIFVAMGSGLPSLPKFASSKSVRAKRFRLSSANGPPGPLQRGRSVPKREL